MLQEIMDKIMVKKASCAEGREGSNPEWDCHWHAALVGDAAPADDDVVGGQRGGPRHAGARKVPSDVGQGQEANPKTLIELWDNFKILKTSWPKNKV